MEIFFEGIFAPTVATSYDAGKTNKSKIYEIESVTIPYILKNYGITPDILKMDCEGCEYAIIMNTDLSMFNDIIFEYHSKIVGISRQVLIDELKNQGFNIKYGEDSSNDLGVIHAYK